MGLLILLGLCFLWLAVWTLGREMAEDAKRRRNDRIMVAWERQEEARAHQYRLAAIETARLNGIRELHRIAAEAKGEIIQGTIVEEVKRP
jgi:hypothetical protein